MFQLLVDNEQAAGIQYGEDVYILQNEVRNHFDRLEVEEVRPLSSSSPSFSHGSCQAHLKERGCLRLLKALRFFHRLLLHHLRARLVRNG